MHVLMPLPNRDFDPTEAAVTWSILSKAGHTVHFATPEGQPARADPIMITGAGLGILRFVLPANRDALQAYEKMIEAPEFILPFSYEKALAKEKDFVALILPGGHAQGMREYLESPVLQQIVSNFFAADKIVAAICHGVVLAARSKRADGKSVLFDKRTTCLLEKQEILAWTLTRKKLGDYYRTYPETVEAEVKSALASPSQFESGPAPLFRDKPSSDTAGYVLRDGQYISARWPGDAHRFANRIVQALFELKAS